MNLFIAVVLEGFYQSHIEYDLHISDSDISHFKTIWRSFDPNAVGFIHTNFLEDFLLALEAPLGWKKKTMSEKEKTIKISHLNLPVYSIKRLKIPLYWFYDILKCLSEFALIEEFKMIG